MMATTAVANPTTAPRRILVLMLHLTAPVAGQFHGVSPSI
jgi:hypothetical protein